MGADYVEILARIRLNLANVDQFLAIACSLADDNPPISGPVHEAAREIRASALLIDHLRSLFCHQQSIEQQRQQQQQQQQQQAYSQAYPQAATTTAAADNLSYFSYSNKQTLIRAAKSLVANTAKILYLTDELILRPACPSSPASRTTDWPAPNDQPDDDDDLSASLWRGEAPLPPPPPPPPPTTTTTTTTEACQWRPEVALHQQAPPACLRGASLSSVHAQTAGPSRRTGVIKLHRWRGQHGGAGDGDGGPHPQACPDEAQDAHCDDDRGGGGRTAAFASPGTDRLDNVANYSQLLRSFGELSVDLIDLGNCITLARHSNEAPGSSASASASRLGLRLARGGCYCGRCCNCCPDSCDQWAARSDREHGQPATPPAGPGLRPSSSSLAMGAHLQPLNPQLYHQSQSSAATTSCLPPALSPQPSLQPLQQQQQQQQHQHTGRHPDARSDSPESSAMIDYYQRERQLQAHWRQRAPPPPPQPPQPQPPLGQQQPCAPAAGATEPLDAAECARPKSLGRCRLRAQLQDMLALFQVNRLIIDRSILLLLSASKCCLRQGREQLSGLEVRKSIGVQLRVSISIIMALVKCSVFGLAGPASSPPPSPAPLLPPPLLPPARELGRQWQRPAPHRRHQQLIDTAPGVRGPDPWEQLRHGLAECQFDELQLAAPTINGERAAPYGAPADRRQQQGQPSDSSGAGSNFGAAGPARAARPMLDIMNHFLLTLDGTRSAHDAITGLQALVEPFARVHSQDGLARGLERAFGPFAKRHQFRAVAGAIEESAHEEQPADGDAGRAWDAAAAAAAATAMAHDKENIDLGAASTAAAAATGRWPPVVLMNKRQLVRALNVVFLGELKQGLVERVHEFTDCAHTKHERRERIVSLLAAIKFLLNKLVKLIYRLRRRVASPSEPLQLAQLRQLAARLVDFCAELNYELQTAVSEHCDELDRSSNELNLLKQLKHHCLVGDATRARQTADEFLEQSERLIELCQQLNQIAATNKLKASTKSLATWFRLNLGQLVQLADCLSGSPHSRALKDCVWTYVQVWLSFYDDFCQLARQVAYLTHANCDPARSARVALHWLQLDQSRANQLDLDHGDPARQQQHEQHEHHEHKHELLPVALDRHHSWAAPGDLAGLGSVHSLSDLNFGQRQAVSPLGQDATRRHQQQQQHQRQHEHQHALNDSPRSLDHYHGFGPNYRRYHDAQYPQFVDASAGQRLAGGASSGLSSHGSSSLMSGGSPSPQFVAERLGQRYNQQQQQQQPMQPQPMQPQQEQQEGDLFEFAPDPTTPTMWNSTDRSGHGGAGPHPNPRHHQSFFATPLGFVAPLAPTSISVDPTAPPIEPPSVPARRFTSAAAGRPAPLQLRDQNQAAAGTRRHRTRGQCAQARPAGRGNENENPAGSPAGAAAFVDGNDDNENENENDDDGAEAEGEREDSAAGAEELEEILDEAAGGAAKQRNGNNKTAAPVDQQSVASSSNLDKWSDSEADAIVRGARETAQMALSMYQFTRGEGDLNTTQDLFTQAELFAEEANELYKEVRCFSYKVPAGDLKKELLYQLSHIPALVQQLQFTVKNPTVGKAATFAKVDGVIRETKCLMESVNRVVEATLSCRQHYNMASASLRKRTRTLSPSYRGDKGGFEFESFDMPGGGRPGGAFGGPGGGRHGPSGASGGMGSEPDI